MSEARPIVAAVHAAFNARRPAGGIHVDLRGVVRRSEAVGQGGIQALGGAVVIITKTQ